MFLQKQKKVARSRALHSFWTPMMTTLFLTEEDDDDDDDDAHPSSETSMRLWGGTGEEEDNTNNNNQHQPRSRGDRAIARGFLSDWLSKNNHQNDRDDKTGRRRRPERRL